MHACMAHRWICSADIAIYSIDAFKFSYLFFSLHFLLDEEKISWIFFNQMPIRLY